MVHWPLFTPFFTSHDRIWKFWIHIWNQSLQSKGKRWRNIKLTNYKIRGNYLQLSLARRTRRSIHPSHVFVLNVKASSLLELKHKQKLWVTIIFRSLTWVTTYRGVVLDTCIYYLNMNVMLWQQSYSKLNTKYKNFDVVIFHVIYSK